jgi:hypothetical protein
VYGGPDAGTTLEATMKKISERLLLLAVCALGFGTVWSAAQPQTPPSAPVTVVNQPTNPVPVTGVVNVTKTIVPVRILETQSVELGVTIARFSDFYTVPAGKRLIVEHLSCSMFLYPPDSLSCGIDEGFFLAHAISPVATPAGTTSPRSIAMGQAMKVIFGPGESLDADLKWSTPTPGTPTATLAVAGYLEDAQ